MLIVHSQIITLFRGLIVLKLGANSIQLESGYSIRSLLDKITSKIGKPHPQATINSQIIWSFIFTWLDWVDKFSYQVPTLNLSLMKKCNLNITKISLRFIIRQSIIHLIVGCIIVVLSVSKSWLAIWCISDQQLWKKRNRVRPQRKTCTCGWNS